MCRPSRAFRFLVVVGALCLPTLAAASHDRVPTESSSSPSSPSLSSSPSSPTGRQGRRMAQLSPEQRAAMRDRIKEKIHTYLTVELSNRAGLDDKKSLRLGAVIKEHLKKKEGARTSRHQAREKLRELVEQKASDAALQAQIQATIDTLGQERAIDDVLKELATFLTPTEQAKVLLAFPEVVTDAKRLIKDARGGIDRGEHGDDDGPSRRGGRGRRGGGRRGAGGEHNDEDDDD
jgi:hypothetical protein